MVIDSDIDEVENVDVEEDNFVKIPKADKRQYIDQIVDEHAPNKKGKLDKHLYKPPTREELDQLSETENLFHSNLFRLQIDEILDTVKIQDKYKKLFDNWFEKFKNQINEINITKELKLEDDILSKKSGVRIPMKELVNECQGTFKFSPPSNIIVGGSYSLGTIVGPNAFVDILVEMPKSVFLRADNKNYRYMRKKAIYLSLIASNVTEELAEQKIFVGCNLNPILKIVPKGKLKKHITIYVHLVAEYTTFEHNRFTPEKNNVKPDWYFKDKATFDTEKKTPTPLYNHAIMHDLTTLKSSNSVDKIKKLQNVKDGIILLKIWLKQRGFCDGFGSFNGHIITMYVLYLLQSNILNTYMSSYQVLRNTWTHLAKSNWYKDGISLCQKKKTMEKIDLYKNYYDCVFLDSTGFCNITTNISENIAKWVSDQAQMAINSLNNSKINDFQILFLRKVPFYLSFDQIICLHKLKALKNVVDAKSNNTDKLKYDLNNYKQITKFITNFLKTGLKNRISLITVMPHKMREWNLSDEIPDDLEKIYVGIQLNSEYAFDIIEKGPEANLPEAEEFRKYWGDLSDLRRFKDSTICETVVWLKENAPLFLKRRVPQKIIKHLFEQKLKLFEKLHYVIISSQIDWLLKLKKVIVPKFYYSNEEVSLKAIKAFDALKSDLTQLSDELPLSIHGVQGCSPVFRYTEVFPPLSYSQRFNDKKGIVSGESRLLFDLEGNSKLEEVPLYLGPIEATMQLSMSGKWPDELEALRMTKAAFYIQIADCVRKQYKLHAHGSLYHVDIMKNGLVFRLRIAHQKEIGLIKQVVDETGVIKYQDNDESIELEKRLFQLPKITGALHGLYCQQPSFGPACCLVKRWLSAQLIDDSHMPDLVVELLLASMYLNPDPYRPTQIPQVTFIRFLELFAREYWVTDPIIVNFNNEMTRKEVIEIENSFGENRDSLPPLFVSSQHDKSSNWTKKAPCPLILNRITSLAKMSLEWIEKQIFEEVNVSFEPLFIPSLSEYDCTIKLKNSSCARRFEAVNIDNLSSVILSSNNEHPKAKMPIIEYDPVAQYLIELRSIYSDFALFFHDTYGGTVIGVLLKPHAMEEKEFKVANTSCQKFSGENKLTLNVSAMLEDFYVLGKGLVENIDVLSKKIKMV